MNKQLILVSGPSRSGKSFWAESIMKKNSSVVYIATSPNSYDKTWQSRIKKHRDRRPNHWNLIESPNDLSSEILKLNSSQSILIDSLGGFVTKYITYIDKDWKHVEDLFVQSLKTSNSFILIVIEEAGWGVVPSTHVGNVFRERLSILAQRLQIISSQSWLVLQGRAINLADISVPIHEHE
tara:strand:+ start:4000 stop:4542 length:543 start_codon:yes stop_codon:yes gene_type:complete